MENGWNWKRIPALLMILLAAAGVLSLGGPAGAAPVKTADPWPSRREEVSPEEALPLASAPERLETPRTKKTAAVPQSLADPPKTQPGDRTPPAPDAKSRSAPADPDEAGRDTAALGTALTGAVEASAPVEDTYFDDVVFLGDSRTEGFYLYSGLKTGKYLYAVGATVESVFTKNAWDSGHGKIPLLDALAEEECGKVYLMLGINELGWSKVENYHDQYAKLIDRVREDHPDAVIVLQSILPVSAKQDAKGSYVNNEKIHIYNEVIAGLAEEKDCAFLDSAQAVTGEDGCLPVEWTFDGVHLNPAGCKMLLEFYRTHSV